MERKKGVVEICYQVVLIIYKKMHLWKISVPGKDRVKTDLSRLYPGENQEERITEYYVREVNNVPHDIFRGNSSDIVCRTWKK